MLLQKLIRLSSIILFVLFAVSVMGQGNSKTDALSELSEGDQMPASVWNKIPKKKTTQLVLLDFWSTGCTSCMEAFPKMEKLQKQFDEKLQVVLLNPWENATEIKERMDKMNVHRVKNEFPPYTMLATLPAINGDIDFKSLFTITGVPQHVWVDAAGTILHITHGHNATPEKIRAVLDGKKLNLLQKNDKALNEVREKGFLQPTLADETPLFYSSFIPSSRYLLFSFRQDVDSAKGVWRKQEWGDVLRHFMTAFRPGNTRQRVVVEVKDKGKYERPSDKNLLDDWYRDYGFMYEIQLPLKDKDKWQEKMKQDVNYFFGNQFGIEAVTEKRKFNGLLLVKTKDGLLKTAGGERDSKWKDGSKSWTNQPFEYVVSALFDLEDMDASRPFLDESGVDPKLKVDMLLTGDLKDLKNVRKQLQQYGLDVIEGKREVEVLVIRDKKQ